MNDAPPGSPDSAHPPSPPPSVGPVIGGLFRGRYAITHIIGSGTFSELMSYTMSSKTRHGRHFVCVSVCVCDLWVCVGTIYQAVDTKKGSRVVAIKYEKPIKEKRVLKQESSTLKDCQGEPAKEDGGIMLVVRVCACVCCRMCCVQVCRASVSGTNLSMEGTTTANGA